MEKYIINYHTGVREEFVAYLGLGEVKEQALEGMAYTQENITIESLDGEVLATSRWYGVEPTGEDEVLVSIGEGFYQLWDDELE